MAVKDIAYIPRGTKRVDLKMSIKKCSNNITIEVRDRDTDESVYFSVNIEKVKAMIEEGGFV